MLLSVYVTNMKVKLIYLTFHKIFLHRIEQFRTTSINVCVRVCVRACVCVRVCVCVCKREHANKRLKATLQIRLVYMHYFINDVCTCLSLFHYFNLRLFTTLTYITNEQDRPHC